MIAKLTGTVDEILDDSIVLDVHGVGYRVLVTNSFLQNIKLNQTLSLKIFHIFKESEQYLCGFNSIEELSIFKVLLDVHGIGAKSALSILSNMTLNTLINAINNQDISVFSSIKGIGAKTAKLIILELKDKLPKISNYTNSDNNTVSSTTDNNIINDAILALTNLGYQRSSVINTVYEISQSCPSLNEIIIKSLHKLSCT